ncbi:GH25 family lysozyme [Clostridium beijerinckii]|uniref:GH25 family lysozyme n=1 Tax=Clostridium beijerinckii TaxID=1520 RepID=UPI00232D2E64|nr:GH25 family lysozyme [Clostridium beijerinckii]
MRYVKGIDISNNNASIDFDKVAEDNIEYVYMKATEGKTFQDSRLEGFYNSCKSNSLKVGAYHFLVSTSSPEAQAENFYGMVKGYEWDMIPMLDIESEFDELCDYIINFVNAFKELSSLQLGIYSYTGFLSNIEEIKSTIRDYPFWEANYNNDPWNLPSNFFTNRIGHQYTENGDISGVSGKCDVNLFTEGVLLKNNMYLGAWINENDKWWYKHKDGTFTKDDWEFINGKWYLFDAEGWMIHDWKKYGDSWYYFGDYNDGAMKTGWYYDEKSSKWYYFNEEGIMQTGCIKIDDKWYHFDSSGAMETEGI